jgi:PAS domain S-box-containing protein
LDSIPGNPSIGTSAADRDYFQGVTATSRPYFGLPAVSRATGHPVVLYGVPLLDSGGALRGVVVGGLSLRALSDVITNIRTGPSVRAALTDRRSPSGTIIVHPDPKRVLSPGSGRNEATARLLAGERGAIETRSSSGELDLSVFTQVPHLPWGILILQPSEAAFSALTELTRSLTIIVSILTAVMMGFGVWLATRLTSPIRALQRVVGAFSSHELSRRAGLKRRDEIGQLGRTFDTMADELEARDTRLRGVLGELERTVKISELARGEMRAVLDAATEAMVLVGTDSRVLSWNKGAAKLFGTPAETVLGKRLQELLPIVQRIFAEPDEFVALVADSLNDPDRQLSEIVFQRWPESRELQLYSTPVASDDGQNLGRLYAYRDVTKEREVDRMKSEFVALVSHELRTPLTSVKGYIDLLLDEEAGEINEAQREFLGIVKASADRLVALINDLLDVSRIDAGKIELNPGPVDIRRIIAEVTTTFRPQLETKHQILTLHLPEDLPNAWADQSRLTQILVNLVSNAHKYTPEGGSIKIAASLRGSSLRVEVIDSGIGISADDQAKLFSKFFRAQNRATEEVGGTGLGLSITRSLVAMHGGQMEVSSTPGQGSTFAFELPLSREPEPTGRQAEPVPMESAKVLVVDDDADHLALIRRYLGRAGYEVIAASNGSAALQLAKTEQPNLITLDLHLPDVHGMQVLGRLKDEPLTADIPVVILSISREESGAKRLGAADYLVKPFDERQLLAKVAGLVAGPARNPVAVRIG